MWSRARFVLCQWAFFSKIALLLDGPAGFEVHSSLLDPSTTLTCLAGARSGGHVSLLNIISELKKACNHPFLFESAEDEYRGSEEDKSAVDRLILTSGKMVLLDKLLTRLRQTGHRVLVFSQVRQPVTSFRQRYKYR